MNLGAQQQLILKLRGGLLMVFAQTHVSLIMSVEFEKVFQIKAMIKASQCGYVVSTSAFRQGDPGSNPITARKSCEVYPGLDILQPQWNPYPTLTPPSC